MKRMISALLALLLLLSLTACGSKVRADEELVGRYDAVTGEMFGFALYGEELDGFSFDLASGGKGTVTIDGESHNISWENDDATITVKVDNDQLVGTRGKDIFVVENIADTGMSLTFAKEGTEAANKDLYIPESERFMLGAWRSAEVKDILGDPVEEIAPDALELEFTSDHHVTVTYDGEKVGTFEWSLLGDWGSLDNEDDVQLSWDILEDRLEVDYTVDDEYYTFTCYQGEPPKTAAPAASDQPAQSSASGSLQGNDSEPEPEQTTGDGGYEEPEESGSLYADYWAGGWYGWWIVDSAYDGYETYADKWVDAGAYIIVREDDTGTIFLIDENDEAGDFMAVVDVSFHPGTTSAGCMMSESGSFMSDEENVLHADWIVDPGASDNAGRLIKMLNMKQLVMNKLNLRVELKNLNKY